MLGVLAFKKNSTVLAKDELEKLAFRPLEILCFGLCPMDIFSTILHIFFSSKRGFKEVGGGRFPDECQHPQN
jgi:hypothetical protein